MRKKLKKIENAYGASVSIAVYRLIFLVGGGAPRVFFRSFRSFMHGSSAAYRVGLRLDNNTIYVHSIERFNGCICFVSKYSRKQLSVRQKQQDCFFFAVGATSLLWRLGKRSRRCRGMGGSVEAGVSVFEGNSSNSVARCGGGGRARPMAEMKRNPDINLRNLSSVWHQENVFFSLLQPSLSI